MTFEEEGEKVMDETISVVDKDVIRTKIQQSKDAVNIAKEDSVRSKMEAMQKRIDELKEKVKNEGELLYCNETVHSQDIIDSKFSDSFSDVKSKDSLSQYSINFADKIDDNEERSDKSLYFSASSYSMCSISSNSSDSTYSSFSKFVNNFMKNQNHKERLNLLQLHSKKQISINMMKTSLLELESRCSEELALVEKSLKHLNKLAEELNVNNEQRKEDSDNLKVKALDLNCSGDGEPCRSMTKASLKFLPVKDGSKTVLDAGKEPALANHKLMQDYDK